MSWQRCERAPEGVTLGAAPVLAQGAWWARDEHGPMRFAAPINPADIVNLNPPPPGVVDPVQDAINNLVSIQQLIAKAQSATGCLSPADWQTMTKNYEAIAGDLSLVIAKNKVATPSPTPAPATSTGMSATAAGALGAGGGLTVGGLVGFAIGRATAAKKGA